MPTQNNLDTIRVSQNLALIKLLQLSIPKRVTYALMDNFRTLSCPPHALFPRKLAYFGHVLRRSEEHLTYRALLSGVRDFESGKPEPWRSQLAWLWATACERYHLHAPSPVNATLHLHCNHIVVKFQRLHIYIPLLCNHSTRTAHTSLKLVCNNSLKSWPCDPLQKGVRLRGGHSSPLQTLQA